MKTTITKLLFLVFFMGCVKTSDITPPKSDDKPCPPHCVPWTKKTTAMDSSHSIPPQKR